MSPEKYAAIVTGSILAIVFIAVIAWRIPKRLKHDRYMKRWKQLQDRCADKEQWPQAIIDADDLLGEALKKRKVKGSNTGERLVSAQKKFTNNDAVWFGHKLRTKIDDNPEIKLAKEDVQKALIGLRQGLKDIGAL